MNSISLKNMEPLTAEEKAFSSALENYDQFFKYMKINKLDQEEWYDILILHYLSAVKKYLNIPHLQQYEFGAVLFRTLDSARSNHCMEGYSQYQTWRKTEKQFPYGYTLYNLERDIEGFRRIFKEVFGI